MSANTPLREPHCFLLCPLRYLHKNNTNYLKCWLPQNTCWNRRYNYHNSIANFSSHNHSPLQQAWKVPLALPGRWWKQRFNSFSSFQQKDVQDALICKLQFCFLFSPDPRAEMMPRWAKSRGHPARLVCPSVQEHCRVQRCFKWCCGWGTEIPLHALGANTTAATPSLPWRDNFQQDWRPFQDHRFRGLTIPFSHALLVLCSWFPFLRTADENLGFALRLCCKLPSHALPCYSETPT